MKSVLYYSKHITVLFAVEELRRLMEKEDACTNTSFDGDHIHLMLESDYNESSFCINKLYLKHDGFAILEDHSDVWIVGKEERSILYGVYQFCEQRFGYRWVGFEEKIDQQYKNTNQIVQIQEPLFSRRGNIIETINDPSYINQLIDWGVKNGLNEFFFTFFLWDEVRSSIIDALAKRDLKVTLGGHSLTFLINTLQVGNTKTQNISFFAKDNSIQDLVIDKIIEICEADSIISRISLWPEDVGVSDSGFMQTYITFMEKLKTKITSRKLDVEVEHIVYNAGLAWNMLERDDKTKPSSHLDVLYAYWGRDYSQAIDHSNQEQIRAYDALIDWKMQTATKNKKITVLEYYSDHFMLSEIFPPLMNMINQDIQSYKITNINGLLNLIVPYHAKDPNSEMTQKYPWKWVQLINNYFYAGLSWGKDYNEASQKFFSAFGENGDQYQKLLKELEPILSKHTSWNVPLFPARLVDPEKVDYTGDIDSIINYLDNALQHLNKQNLKFDYELLKRQHKNNFSSFSNEEMINVYLYYLMQTLKMTKDNWREKQDELRKP
ncbi:hypothetical protein NC797_01310 [Aquibacillus sp. 3ASR75-11]|uniref:Alpha glucuronidase N-terminal domain-containing protein n=1 Tax=Terrihalobacillus insolitus TaxID=2950438 RepID=A0A9X4AM49_9BACI|nr:hypothetical protein [Terrihalobacillus insolitus]MDC3412162.1 hypothetical protein [Terrihalobacillus insolitus]MDC3423145.1 hypothetical protein [Terrihalobacillus insolitus]